MGRASSEKRRRKITTKAVAIILALSFLLALIFIIKNPQITGFVVRKSTVGPPIEQPIHENFYKKGLYKISLKDAVSMAINGSYAEGSKFTIYAVTKDDQKIILSVDNTSSNASSKKQIKTKQGSLLTGYVVAGASENSSNNTENLSDNASKNKSLNITNIAGNLINISINLTNGTNVSSEIANFSRNETINSTFNSSVNITTNSSVNATTNSSVNTTIQLVTNNTNGTNTSSEITNISNSTNELNLSLNNTGIETSENVKNSKNASEENKSETTTPLTPSTPKIIYFDFTCEDSCDMPAINVSSIKVDVEKGSVNIDTLKYNLAEVSNFSLTKNFSNQTMVIGDKLILNAGDYFTGNGVSYDASSSDGYNYSVKSDVITIKAISPGKWPITIYAAKGATLVKSNPFFIDVIEKNKSVNTTKNKSLNKKEVVKVDAKVHEELRKKNTVRVILKKVRGYKLPTLDSVANTQTNQTNESSEVIITKDKNLINLKTDIEKNKQGNPKKNNVQLSAKSVQLSDSSLNNAKDILNKSIVINAIQDTNDFVAVYLTADELANLTSNPGFTDVLIDEPASVLTTESMNITKITDVQNKGNDGSGVKICVLDTGLNYTALGLTLNSTVYGKDFINNDDDPMDDNGHGTEVTYALSQSAPGATLIIGKVMDANGQGYASDVLAGLNYCQSMGANIISMSIGAGNYSGYCDSDVVAKKVNNLTASGILVVAASGNDGSNSIKSPACASYALPVGASTKQDTLATFTSYNNATILLAPGENIQTINQNGAVTSATGTSMSVPFVSGAAALILQTQTKEPSQLKSLLVQSGDVITANNRQFSRLNALNAFNNNLTNNLTPQSVYVNGTSDNFTTQFGPTVTYVSPTPADQALLYQNSVTINVTVVDTTYSIIQCNVTLGGTQYTMTMVGSGKSVSCIYTNATTDGTSYTYHVLAVNSRPGFTTTSARTFRENAKPSISSVNITPNPAYPSNNLVCNVSGWNDAENASEQYYYNWYKGGSLQYSFYQNESTSTLNAANTTAGDTWNCTVTPYDGYENGTAKSDARFIYKNINQSCTSNSQCYTNNCLDSIYQGTTTSKICCATDDCVSNSNVCVANRTTISGNTCYSGTWISSQGQFAVKNTTGSTLFAIDKYGSMIVSGTTTQSCSSQPSTTAWKIEDTTGSAKIYVDSTGDMCVYGSITQRNVGSACTTTKCYLVQNSAGQVKARLYKNGSINLAGDFSSSVGT